MPPSSPVRHEPSISCGIMSMSSQNAAFENAVSFSQPSTSITTPRAPAKNWVCIAIPCRESAPTTFRQKSSLGNANSPGASPVECARSLGWIPFNTGHARWCNGQVYFNGTAYGVWNSYGLAGYTLRSGSFSEDSRGSGNPPVQSPWVLTWDAGSGDHK